MNSDAHLEPWMIEEADYPQAEEMEARIRFLLGYAILAPSGHNTQPWLFRIDGDAVEVRADRTRGLSVVDPDDRALVLSCGAAIENLVIAARHFGRATSVKYLPDRNDEDLLVRVDLAPDGVDDSVDDLFEAITERRSNRREFEDRELPVDLIDRLNADGNSGGVWIETFGGAAREPVARLVAEGDATQMEDRRFRRELASWMHPNRSRTADGMRGYGFGFGELKSMVGPLAVRSFDIGKSQAEHDRALAEGSPLLAVIGTTSDDPESWIRAGQAMQRVLLRARSREVWASFLNQPIEVDELRPKLAAEAGRAGEFPQVLIRLGYGPEVKPEPRRAVAEVLTGEAPALG